MAENRGRPRSSDAGQAEVESLVDEANEKGYIGEVALPDKSAFNLSTGPESPNALEQTKLAAQKRLEAMDASTAGGAK